MNNPIQTIHGAHGDEIRMFKNHFGHFTIQVSNFDYDNYYEMDIYESASISLDKKRAKRLRDRLDELINSEQKTEH